MRIKTAYGYYTGPMNTLTGADLTGADLTGARQESMYSLIAGIRIGGPSVVTASISSLIPSML